MGVRKEKKKKRARARENAAKSLRGKEKKEKEGEFLISRAARGDIDLTTTTGKRKIFQKEKCINRRRAGKKTHKRGGERSLRSVQSGGGCS